MCKSIFARFKYVRVWKCLFVCVALLVVGWHSGNLCELFETKNKIIAMILARYYSKKKNSHNEKEIENDFGSPHLLCKI